jgi:hypothetical protein
MLALRKPKGSAASKPLSIRFSAIRTPRGMRQFFLFLIFFIGLFWVIDVYALEGRNSAGAWQEVVLAGQKVSGIVRSYLSGVRIL